MQRLTTYLLLTLLLCCVAATELLAQSKQGDTVSHRRIPLSDGAARPNLRSFLPPDNLRKEYLEYLRRSQKRNRETYQRQQQTNPFRDLMPREESPRGLRPERTGQRPRVANGSQEQPTSPLDFSLNEESLRKIGKSVGEAISEFQQPGSVGRDREQYVLEEYRRRQREARQKYSDALKSFKESWPDDSVAPEEWLEKVQPFINSEVMEQIIEAGKQFDSQASVPPSDRRFQNLENFPLISDQINSKSNSMIDSFMKSLDKQSTNWLKSEKRKSSLWKNISKSASKSIANLNQKMTANSKERARANSKSNTPLLNNPRRNRATPRDTNKDSESRPTSRTNAETPSPGQASETEQNQGAWLGIIGVCVCLIAVAAYLLRDRFSDLVNSESSDSKRILAERIHDRDSLLRACHALALDLFGFRSRFWHHRKLFASLAEHVEAKKNAVHQLSALYEQARYAPRKLLDGELDNARELFRSLQRQLRTDP